MGRWCISMNGISFSLDSTLCYGEFHLKDMVRIKLFLPRHATEIDTAIVVRKHKDENLMAIFFDQVNPNMIQADEASAISSFIYGILKKEIHKITASVV